MGETVYINAGMGSNGAPIQVNTTTQPRTEKKEEIQIPLNNYEYMKYGGMSAGGTFRAEDMRQVSHSIANFSGDIRAFGADNWACENIPGAELVRSLTVNTLALPVDMLYCVTAMDEVAGGLWAIGTDSAVREQLASDTLKATTENPQRAAGAVGAMFVGPGFLVKGAKGATNAGRIAKVAANGRTATAARLVHSATVGEATKAAKAATKAANGVTTATKATVNAARNLTTHPPTFGALANGTTRAAVSLYDDAGKAVTEIMNNINNAWKLSVPRHLINTTAYSWGAANRGLMTIGGAAMINLTEMHSNNEIFVSIHNEYIDYLERLAPVPIAYYNDFVIPTENSYRNRMRQLGAPIEQMPKLTDFGKQFYRNMGGMVDVNQKFDMTNEEMQKALYETIPELIRCGETHALVEEGKKTIDELSPAERKNYQFFQKILEIKGTDDLRIALIQIEALYKAYQAPNLWDMLFPSPSPQPTIFEMWLQSLNQDPISTEL